MASAPGGERGGFAPPSLRALKRFWAVVAGVVALTGVVLAVLGPPAPPAPPPLTARLGGAPPAPVIAPPPATLAPPSAPAPAAPAPVIAAAPAPAPEPIPVPASVPDQPIPRAEPAMLETGPFGPLPRIAANGLTPMQAYARPFDRADRRPRVALVLGGLGMNAAMTGQFIERLPPAVTLAFSPYATQVTLLLDRARARGMETLVALPLEPQGYPMNSPGDRALLTSLNAAENDSRLDWALSRFTGYVGAIGALGPMRGERYAALSERFLGLQEALQKRGLLYVDPRPGATSPARAWGAPVDVVVDDPPNRLSIDRKLGILESTARERGIALGYAGEPTPVLLERLAAWAGSIESRGSVLAPVSVLIRRPQATAAAR